MIIITPAGSLDAWGFILSFLDEENPEPASKQFDHNYVSGWRPFPGFKFDAKKQILSYPGDPPMKAIGKMNFRDETILLFPHAWIVIVQADGKWEACRMD